MKIVIDPGHGGKDPGAVGPSGIKEVNINLQVALMVAKKLQKAGLSVKLTRTTNTFVDLQPRCDIANSWMADYFVSIHCNAASTPQAHGTETYCYKFGGKGEVLAKAIQAELIAATGRANRGVKEANFYVLRKTSMPAVLTELAFISNLVEERLLTSAAYQEKCAMAIAKGIGKVIGVDIAEQAHQPEPPQPQASVLYYVQTGAYKVKANADAQYHKVKAAGFDTIIKKSGDLYRVQVGAFAVKENAENMARRVKKAGFDVYITTEGGTPVAPGPEPKPKQKPQTKTIKVGSKVKVKFGAKTYDGKGLADFVYKTVYDVIQINGNRVVIGRGKAVTAAIKAQDLILL